MRLWSLAFILAAAAGCSDIESGESVTFTGHDPFENLIQGADRGIPPDGPDAGKFVGPRVAVAERPSIGTILPGGVRTTVTVGNSTSTTGVRTSSGGRHIGGGCYVGPRGGTYTLTSNGNANYNGC